MNEINKHSKTKINTSSRGPKTSKRRQGSRATNVTNPWPVNYWLYYLTDPDDTIFGHLGDCLVEYDGALYFTLPEFTCEDGSQSCWCVEQFDHVLRVNDFGSGGMPRFPEEHMVLVVGKEVTRIFVQQSGPSSVNVVAQELYPVAQEAVPNGFLPWDEIVKEVAS
jgi:hypothetical protein